MKILGSIMEVLLPVMILGTTLVLFISLPISPTHDSTLVENIFGSLEHQKEKREK
jgi:hypothetical protein